MKYDRLFVFLDQLTGSRVAHSQIMIAHGPGREGQRVLRFVGKSFREQKKAVFGLPSGLSASSVLRAPEYANKHFLQTCAQI